jgi:hypothetical protein
LFATGYTTVELKRAINSLFMPRKSFFSTQPLTPGEFATNIRAKIQFKMSVYITVKTGHVIKAFTSSLFAVRVRAFFFIAINLPDMAAKSNFRG